MTHLFMSDTAIHQFALDNEKDLPLTDRSAVSKGVDNRLNNGPLFGGVRDLVDTSSVLYV